MKVNFQSNLVKSLNLKEVALLHFETSKQSVIRFFEVEINNSISHECISKPGNAISLAGSRMAFNWISIESEEELSYFYSLIVPLLIWSLLEWKTGTYKILVKISWAAYRPKQGLRNSSITSFTKNARISLIFFSPYLGCKKLSLFIRKCWYGMKMFRCFEFISVLFPLPTFLMIFYCFVI